DFLDLWRLVTNEGTLRRLKNGLLEAVERRVGLDPRSFPGGEVTIAPLVVVARGTNETVGIASGDGQARNVSQVRLKALKPLGVASCLLANKRAAQINVSCLEDRRSLKEVHGIGVVLLPFHF